MLQVRAVRSTRGSPATDDVPHPHLPNREGDVISLVLLGDRYVLAARQKLLGALKYVGYEYLQRNCKVTSAL